VVLFTLYVLRIVRLKSANNVLMYNVQFVYNAIIGEYFRTRRVNLTGHNG